MNTRQEFDKLTGRRLALNGFGALLVSGIAVGIIRPSWFTATASDPRGEALWGFALYFVLLLMLWRLGRVTNLSQARLWGARPTPQMLRQGLMLVTPLIAVSMGAFPLVFIPLSAIAPGAVNWVLTDVPSLIPSSGESKALLAGVNLTLLVILGPIVEEILFRGYLLQRWAKKWGTFWAVMWSSAAFAVLHFEIIGGFVFGVVCAMLYIEFRSLWVPIVVHSANNLVAAIMTLWGELSTNGETVDVLVELRQGWWIGVVALGVGVPWIYRYLRRHWKVLGQPVPYAA